MTSSPVETRNLGTWCADESTVRTDDQKLAFSNVYQHSADECARQPNTKNETQDEKGQVVWDLRKGSSRVVRRQRVNSTGRREKGVSSNDYAPQMCTGQHVRKAKKQSSKSNAKKNRLKQQ